MAEKPIKPTNVKDNIRQASEESSSRSLDDDYSMLGSSTQSPIDSGTDSIVITGSSNSSTTVSPHSPPPPFSRSDSRAALIQVQNRLEDVDLNPAGPDQNSAAVPIVNPPSSSLQSYGATAAEPQPTEADNKTWCQKCQKWVAQICGVCFGKKEEDVEMDTRTSPRSD